MKKSHLEQSQVRRGPNETSENLLLARLDPAR
jgi:hypothetical protein